MEKALESQLGFFAIISWCIISAIAYVFSGFLVINMTPFLFCFGVFFVTALFFNILNFRKISYKKIRANIKDISIINVTTCACWVLTIFPLQFIEPSILNSIVLSVLPIATLIVGLFLYKGQNINKIDYIMSAFLFCGLLFLLVISLNQKTAMMGISSQDIVISLLCCIGAGIALAINNIYAKKLSNSHFSPSEILTVRFFLIIIFSGVFTYKSIPLLFLWNNAVNIVIIAIMLIIIPQVILQYAIKGLQPITVSVIAPLMPVLTFFIEFFNKNLNPTVWSISGVFYIFVISAMAAIFRYRK